MSSKFVCNSLLPHTTSRTGALLFFSMFYLLRNLNSMSLGTIDCIIQWPLAGDVFRIHIWGHNISRGVITYSIPNFKQRATAFLQLVILQTLVGYNPAF